MDFRLAAMQDLQQLKAVYRQIIQNMEDNHLQIWDDIYPIEFFEQDIRSGRLYVLLDNSALVSAFSLCGTSAGENAVNWKGSGGKCLYLERFGVNANYRGRGIGSLMLAKAKDAARALGADHLRLFVVDRNEPAIRLYDKTGFQRADGVYIEAVDDGLTLREYGYEAALSRPSRG